MKSLHVNETFSFDKLMEIERTLLNNNGDLFDFLGAALC